MEDVETKPLTLAKCQWYSSLPAEKFSIRSSIQLHMNLIGAQASVIVNLCCIPYMHRQLLHPLFLHLVHVLSTSSVEGLPQHHSCLFIYRALEAWVLALLTACWQGCSMGPSGIAACCCLSRAVTASLELADRFVGFLLLLHSYTVKGTVMVHVIVTTWLIGRLMDWLIDWSNDYWSTDLLTDRHRRRRLLEHV